MRDFIKFMLLNIGTWVLWFFIVGYLVTKIKDKYLEKDYLFTSFFEFEKDGTWFKKYLKIDKWKDRVPELGGYFGDGFEKRSVADAQIDQIKLFIRETRRAELAHWVMTAGWIFTTAFNPLWAIVFNLVFAHVVNFPCLIIQRYNRARLIKVLNYKS
jgi:glycosyl-4,4'-diaponeurosporenoate acyltransferase